MNPSNQNDTDQEEENEGRGGGRTDSSRSGGGRGRGHGGEGRTSRRGGQQSRLRGTGRERRRAGQVPYDVGQDQAQARAGGGAAAAPANAAGAVALVPPREERRHHHHGRRRRERAAQAAGPADPNASTIPSLYLASENGNIFMLTTLQEKLWALELKMAVANDPSNQYQPLAVITDMEYQQHALLSRGNLPASLTRLKGLQEFRRYYGIDNSVEQGIHYLHRLFQVQHGFVIQLSYETKTQKITRILDMGKLNPKVATSHANGMYYNWKSTIIGLYYLYWCCQPTFTTIRNGILDVIDFIDFDWSRNFDEEFEQTIWEELRAHVPIQFSSILLFNTGSVDSNACWTLLQPFWVGNSPANTKIMFGRKSKIKLGCQIIDPTTGGSRIMMPLRNFYPPPPPTPEQVSGAGSSGGTVTTSTTQSLLQQAKEMLELRNQNEKGFVL